MNNIGKILSPADARIDKIVEEVKGKHAGALIAELSKIIQPVNGKKTRMYGLLRALHRRAAENAFYTGVALSYIPPFDAIPETSEINQKIKFTRAEVDAEIKELEGIEDRTLLLNLVDHIDTNKSGPRAAALMAILVAKVNGMQISKRKSPKQQEG